MSRLPLQKISFKTMVAFEEFTPPMLFAMQEVAQVMVANHSAMVVTSGNDRRHRTGSDHYTDDAFDVRTRLLATVVLHDVHLQIKRRLGPCFLVLNEGNHFHIAYRPKPAKTIPYDRALL